MPRVPRYLQQTQARALPTPNVQVQTGGVFSAPGAALAQAGQAIQQVGQSVDQAQQRIQAARDKASATLLMEREAELDRVVNERLYTGEGALMLTAGRAAAEREPKVLEEIEALRAKLGDGLQGDARRTWDLRTGGKLQDIRRRTTGYVHQQLGVAREAAARLHEQQGLATVANVWSDAQALETQIVAMESAAAAAEDVPEARAARVSRVRAAANVAAIQSAIGAKDYDWAEQRLAQMGDALPPVPRAQLRQVIATAKEDRAADATTSEIIAGSVNDQTGWVDEARALRALDEAPAEQREKLRPRVIQRLQEAKRIQASEIEAVYDRAFTGYLQQGSRGIAPADRTWLETRAPETWRRLQQMQRADADRWRVQRDRAERERAPQVTGQQRVVESEILARIRANPEEWAQRPVQDILADAEEMGVPLLPSQVKTLGTALAGVKARVAKDEREGRTVSNDEWKRQVEADLDSLKITGKTQRTKAHAYLNERRARWMDENGGKPPPREEVQRWRVEAFTMDDGGVWQRKGFRFERSRDSNFDVLPAEEQTYLPSRAALEPEVTTITEPLDVSSTAETGGFGLDTPPRNVSTPEANLSSEREAARQLLRSRGLPADDAAVDALFDRAQQRAGGVTSGAGDQR